jgi:triosephosphate isomerase
LDADVHDAVRELFAGGEPLDVPEAMELLSGGSVKKDRGPDLAEDSVDGIRVGSGVPRWAAGRRHERRLWLNTS